jgi:diaminohydroxyphosphoribosylaminopyrimidine deaminase/5-amino-6-(5-phosphoribosylamino)uracil reductase
VVIAIEDPDPRVSGQGIARLREAGIAVEVGLCALEAREINAGFLIRMRDGRPLVTLKLASTLDGRIATAHGDSQWITGAPARDRGHLLRASHDAIMVGSNTVLRDNPHLTCRLPGLAAASPVRLVVDRALRVPLTARLVAEAQAIPTWFIIRQGADEARCEAFEGAGVKLIEVRPTATGEIDLAAAFRELGKLGLTRVLVEGGAMLAAALLRADLVDRLAWFRAPILIGGDGLGSVAPFGIDSLAAAPRFVRASVEEIGDDVLETLQRAP